MTARTDRVQTRERERQLTKPVLAQVSRRYWQLDAACGQTPEPDAFTPLTDEGVEAARRFCRTCPVLADCLSWALAAGVDGVWGGTTEDERRGMRRRA
jgi:WhiB family redox-sensing transcriptional regulator